jgi:hypothetical protein
MRVLWILPLACLMLGPVADAKVRLHKPRRGFQMRMTPFVVLPGGDREGCEYRVTPNRKAMDVTEFQLQVTPGAHHFVVWEYLGKEHNPADFWKGIQYAAGCVGLGPSFFSNANLFGMMTVARRFQLPPGVAIRLEPHAAIYPDLHLHNYSTAPMMAEAVFNLIPARKGTVRHHAQALTIGFPKIDIPALGSASLTGEWRTSVGMNLVQLSTHQHHRGTGMSIRHLDAAGGDMGELVTSADWEHPDVRAFPEVMHLSAGEGLRFTCDWTNPDDHAVHFGVTTEDEMCFVTGYFYPDDESVRLGGPGCVPQGAGLECFVVPRTS